MGKIFVQLTAIPTIAVVTVLLLAQTALATPVFTGGQTCFHNSQDYQTWRSRLPVELQQGELFGVIDNAVITGAFKITQIDGLFHFEMHGRLGFDAPQNRSTVITAVCAHENRIYVGLATGNSDYMTLIPPSRRAPLGQFHYRGFDFVRTDQAGYDRIANRFIPRPN